MKEKQNKSKQKKSPASIKIGQFLYLSFTIFNRNVLWDSASACSYGFICSFIPIVFLICTLFLGIVRVSPGIIVYIQQCFAEFFPGLDFSNLIQNALANRHVFSVMDIVLILWIIWMARKLNISIIRSLNRIFGAESKRKNWWIQILTFISEFALVFLIAILILLMFIARKIINEPIFESIVSKFPSVIRHNSNIITSLSMYFILFICTFLSYKLLTGVKPSTKTSFICSIMNTACFFGLVKLFDTFVNRANYNFVYGTISTIIIMIIKVYFFFILFLFFAQTIYVSEYFDQLLKSQIYFLPKEQDANFIQAFIRMLFINPSILQNEDNTLIIPPNNTVFSKGEPVDSVLYLQKGIIAEQHDDGTISYYESGTLIGETLCILNENYVSSAIALTKCEIVSFGKEEFMQILQKDSRIAKKAVTKVHDYTSVQNLE